MSTDRIEKKLLLRAPIKRVWHALSDPKEFETWFGFKVEGPFQPGTATHGVIVGTKANAEVGKMQEKAKGLRFNIKIEKMEPEKLFSYRWHPNAIDPSVDYSAEPMTLVEFHLAEVPEGTMLTLVESGFDDIPLQRRATAFSANDGGWTIMTKVLEEYVVQTK